MGAGASYEAGMPLVWELTAELKDWLTAEKLRSLNAGWRIQGNGFPDQIIDDLISVLERPDTHYESILGYLETQYIRQHSLAQQYHGLYSWLVEMVYYLLYYRQINNAPYLEKNLPFYDGLKALADQNTPLWVFSLNHDVMVELLAARLSIPLHSGFGPSTLTLPRRNAKGVKIGEIKAQILQKDEIEKGPLNFPNPLQPGIYLLKIHGALDIFAFNDGHQLLKLAPDGLDTTDIIEALRAANEDLIYLYDGNASGKVKATNEIAFADDTGEMQFLRRSLLAGAYKFNDRKDQVFPKQFLKHFKSNINFVSNLVIVGYGFGDLHINQVMREWLEFTDSRSIEIVSPIQTGIPSFLSHLSPQVTLVQSTATDYLDEIAGIKRTSDEIQSKRTSAIGRKLSKKASLEVFKALTNDFQQRIVKAIIKKLSRLPLKDGQPDLSKLGNPPDITRKWMREARLDEAGFLNQLAKRFEKAEKDAKK